MHAELEPLAFVLRVFPEGSQYGDPYTWAATVVRVDHETAEIMGAMRAPTKEERHAIGTAMATRGFKFGRCQKGDGRVRRIRFFAKERDCGRTIGQ